MSAYQSDDQIESPECQSNPGSIYFGFIIVTAAVPAH